MSKQNGQRKQLTIPQEDLEYIAKQRGVLVNQICCVCGTVITVQIFKNSGVCCENHRKDRDNDHAPFRGGALSP